MESSGDSATAIGTSTTTLAPFGVLLARVISPPHSCTMP